MAVANTVITQENSSLQTMGTDQLLDLFVLDDSKQRLGASHTSDSDTGKKDSRKKDNIRSILDSLEDLWDESQYENEYNIESFMKSLGNSWDKNTGNILTQTSTVLIKKLSKVLLKCPLCTRK